MTLSPRRPALAILLSFLLSGCPRAGTAVRSDSATPSQAAPGVAPETIVLSDELDLRELESGIWLYRATFEMKSGPVESNGLVIEGEDGAIVIDTPWTDELTALLLDWVVERAGKVHAAVATHFHPDRLGGMGEVHRREIPSYGHFETARIAAQQDLPTPGVTFEEHLTLSAGSRTVELFYPGPGHSPDNIVVWLPAQKLLFGGCMLKSAGSKRLGYVGDALIESWGASLESLLERYPSAEIVVPGHGEPGGFEILEHTSALIVSHLGRRTEVEVGRA